MFTWFEFHFFRSVSLRRDSLVLLHKPTAALPTLSWWAMVLCLFCKHPGSSSNLLLSCEGAPHAMPWWVGHTFHLQFLEMPLTVSRLQDSGVALLWGYDPASKPWVNTEKNPTTSISCLQSVTSPTGLHDCIIKACFQRSFIMDDVSSSASYMCDLTLYESMG